MILFQGNSIDCHGLVELRIELKQPKLYLDVCIEIITEKKGVKRCYLTLRPDARRTRILRIPKDTKEIRLNPSRYDGDIELKQKQLIKFVLPITAWIIYRRLKHHKRKFILPIKRLWKVYNQTFDIQMGIKNYSYWVKSSESRVIEKGDSTQSSSLKKLNILVFPSPERLSEDQIIKLDRSGEIEIYDLTKNWKEKIAHIQGLIHEHTDHYFLMIFNTDQLSKSALITEYRNLEDSDLIYTDDDFITNGKRHSPNFKPNWNPEFWEESNYIGRAAIFKAPLLKHLDWNVFSPTKEGIRTLINSNEPEKLNIMHIPHICLHQHAVKLPLPKEERWVNKNAFINKRKLPEEKHTAELLIPTKDKVDILKACIDSILKKTSYTNFKITILDNNSSEPETLSYLEQITENHKIKVLKYPHPFNYSAINNFGAGKSDADVLILVNNDIEVVSPNWLEELISIATKKEIGCVGAKLYYPNGWIQHAGVTLGIGDIAGHSHRFYPGESLGYMGRLAYRQQISAVTGACLAIERSIWDKAGGLDEQNLTVAYNDVDFCLRVQELGYRNIWTPYAELIHHESVSRGADDTPQKKKRYLSEVAYMRKRWAKELEHDPFYHQAFSRTKEDFSLQF